MLTQVLPTLHCLPCGLELSPSWSVIKKLIDDSDYYVLLSGSRYGTLSPSGVSYTHMEYVYAATKQKPILVLMHESPETRPVELQEQRPEGRRQLNDFRQLLQKGLVARWSNARDLDTALRHYLPQLIKSSPASGWVRANGISNPELTREITALKLRLEGLEQEREQWLGQQAASLGPLSLGQDIFEVMYRCKAYAAGNCEEVPSRSQLSWNAIFMGFAPYLSQPQHEDFMAAKISERVQENALADVQSHRPKTHAITDIAIAPLCFNTIKIQFRTLGLIRRVQKLDDNRGWWQLTAAGEQHLASLMTVRKSQAQRPS